LLLWRQGGTVMQLTFGRLATDESVRLGEVAGLPVFGFMSGSVISLALWGALVWTAWAVLG